MGQGQMASEKPLDDALAELTAFTSVATHGSAKDAVEQVVSSIVGSLSGELSAEELQLYREVEGLAAYIHQARAEVAALNPKDIQAEFLPTATDELDAIIQATENATGAIMDATEAIEDVAETLDPEAAGRLQDAVTGIYEACSFQDITGQRITKVVRMLKSIEERVDALVSAFEPGQVARKTEAPDGKSLQEAGNHGREKVAAQGDKDDDGALLNGPQADGQAMGQDDIDALLRGFD